MTISDKIRVYELSRDLNLENKDVLDAAQKLSITVKSHSSSISLEDAKKIKNLITKKNAGEQILSVNKPKNIDKQGISNKTRINNSNQKKSNQDGLNKKPQLIKPINKMILINLVLCLLILNLKVREIIKIIKDITVK